MILGVDAAPLGGNPMSLLYQEHQLSAEQRRALELLADAGDQGCTGATFLAYGFKADILAELVAGGLALVHRQTPNAGEWPIEVARIVLNQYRPPSEYGPPPRPYETPPHAIPGMQPRPDARRVI
jgi:hypothetical protein